MMFGWFQGPPGLPGQVGSLGSLGPLGSQGPRGPPGSAGPRGFPVSGYFSPFSLLLITGIAKACSQVMLYHKCELSSNLSGYSRDYRTDGTGWRERPAGI